MNIQDYTRGAAIFWKDKALTVLYVCRKDGGGCGMGEYPAEVTLVLSDGTILSANAWNSWTPKQLYGPI